MKTLSVAIFSPLILTPVIAGTADGKLHEIEHCYKNSNVISGPKIVDCTLSRGTSYPVLLDNGQGRA